MSTLSSNFSESIGNSKDINILNISINAYKKDLLIDTDLKIVNQYKYGLIGKNGIGKSTLLKHMVERKFPISEKIDILYVEQEIDATDKTVLETVMEAHQERLNLIKRQKELEKKLDEDENPSDEILNEYNEVLETLTSIGADKDESKVKRILYGLGFTIEQQLWPTKKFSGGWRMRISLAKALYMEPTLLLLDEPTNHLDLKAAIWLTEYLKKWKKTLIVVSHNQNFLNQVCNRIINIEEKKLAYYEGNYENFRKAYLAKMKQKNKEWEKMQKKIEKMTKKSVPVKERNEFIKKSGLQKPPKIYEVKVHFSQIPEISQIILEMENVYFGYNEDSIILEDINLKLNKDSRITIVGENGKGKSTLLNLMLGNLKPIKGYITQNIKLRIGHYDQHFGDFLPKEETPISYIKQMLSQHNKIPIIDNTQNPDKIEKDLIQNIRKSLGTIGLESYAHEIAIANLSGGQKARVAFVALDIINPHLLLLDEPTNHLDIETIDGLIDGLNQYNGAVVIVSHDLELITKTNSELWMIKDKKLEKYHGDYEDYRDEILSEIEELD